MYRGHYCLAMLFFKQGRLNDALTHLKHARSNIFTSEYQIGRVMHLQARVHYQQSQLNEALSEALTAVSLLEKVEATELGDCKELLQQIQDKMNELGSNASAT